MWADFVTYTGSEDFYWNSHQKIGGNQWGHIIANDANVWLEFRNTSTSATANTGNGTQADGNVWSDSEPYGIHTAKVPAGTWNQVTVKRGQQGSWSNTGQTFTLETGKNYIGPGDEGLGVYGSGSTPSGDTFQGGEVFYMKQNTICKDGNSHDFLKYGRCDFNLYDEGGTFLDKALSAQVIPGTDPVMLKFVVPAEYAGTVWGKVKVKQLETGGAGHNETNKGAIPKDGKNYLVNGNTMEWSTYAEPEPSTTTYTVTLHPNNGGASTIVKENVPKGSTSSAAALGLSSITYGNGTATWYTNAECTTPFTSVTEDNMDLYAKWGVSGNFYLVGDFGMHDKGSNWAYNSGLAMTTTDGVASVTYIAPKGRHRFEILTGRSSWPSIPNQGSGLIAASTPTLSWSNEGAGGYYHFKFDLDAPKKVTVRYDGKVSVTAEDYVVAKTGWTVASKSLFGHGSEESPDNADDGAYMNGYNMTEGQMNSDGELVIHNLNAGTYKFWIGKYNTALNKQKQNVEVFGAAHVDKANSSLGDYGSLANVSDDTYNRSIPMDDKLHRRVTFTLTQKADIKIAFDGGKIKVNVLPTHTVTFKNGETTFTTAQVFDGNVATAPASNPEKAGHEFTGWDWNFTTPITGDQIINAQFSYKDIESVSLNESTHMT